MIRFIVDDIIAYIKDEISHEDYPFRDLIKFLNKDLRSEKNRKWSKMNENTKWLYIERLTNYKKQIEKIKSIRYKYQKGKEFVTNQTKGKKKRNIQYLTLIETREQAKEHLEFIKKYRSERTYFRHKKILKERGIINDI